MNHNSKNEKIRGVEGYMKKFTSFTGHAGGKSLGVADLCYRYDS
jgi:hypothetical protein